MKSIQLFTDGACSGNPGPGGWAAILKYKNYTKEFVGGDKHTTNNRMEMMAIIEGLKKLNQPCNVSIYTDSAYIYNAFNNGWIRNWEKNNWLKSDNKPVLNQDLWELMISIMTKHTCTWVKVKGHSGHPENERCDQLAVNFYKENFL